MADGSVVFTTELDSAGIKQGLDSIDSSINNWGAAIVGSKAFRAVTEGLISVTKAGIEYNAQMEMYQTNFGVLLGDQAAALEHVAELREMAAKTPFGMEDLANASQTLLAFGADAESVMESLQMLGDISLGSSEKMSSLTLAFAQVSAAGKLTGQDLLQMVNAGFNPLNTIAEITGTTLGDLKEVMAGGKGSKEFQAQMQDAQKEVKKLGEEASEGAKLLAQIGEEGVISAEMVGIAMEKETSPGGRFYNGMEQASQTMSGLFSTLKDDSAQLAGNIFSPLSDVLKNVVLPAALDAVGALNELFEVDGTVQISAETQGAIDAINALDDDILKIKNKYVEDSIKIKIEYEQSLTLIEELEAIQLRLDETPRRLWSEQDVTDLQNLTNQLVNLNPQLSALVGKDGIINAEAQAIRELVTEYKELAIVEGAREAAAASWDVYFQAEVEAERLRVIRTELEAQRQAAIETGNAWTILADNAGLAFDALSTRTADMVGLEQMTTYVENAREALQGYIDMVGGLDPDVFEGINLSAFFDGFTLLSAEEIINSSDAMRELGAAMEVVGNAALAQESIQQTAVDQLTAELEAGSAAVTTAENAASEALGTAQSYESTIESLVSGVSGLESVTATAATDIETVQTTGDTLGESEWLPTLEVTEAAETALDDIDSVQTDGDALGESEWLPTIDVSEGAASALEDIGNVQSDGDDLGSSTWIPTINADDQASSVISSVSSQLSSLDGRVATVTVRTVQTGSTTTKTTSGVSANQIDGIHADGLDYVPFDNYLALLHEGEMVLTAKEAAHLRELSSSSYASSLASRTVAGVAMRSVDKAAGEKVVQQTINFNVPVQTPDEFAQTVELFATYGLEADY